MTTEEMLDVLLNSEKEFGDVWIEAEQCKAIATKLRAAEEFYKAFEEWWVGNKTDSQLFEAYEARKGRHNET